MGIMDRMFIHSRSMELGRMILSCSNHSQVIRHREVEIQFTMHHKAHHQRREMVLFDELRIIMSSNGWRYEISETPNWNNGWGKLSNQDGIRYWENRRLRCCNDTNTGFLALGNMDTCMETNMDGEKG